MTDPKGHYYSRGGQLLRRKEVDEEATKGCIRSKLNETLLASIGTIIRYQRNSTGQYNTPRLVPISSFLGHIKIILKKKLDLDDKPYSTRKKMFNVWWREF